MSRKIGLAIGLVLVLTLSISGIALGTPVSAPDAKPIKHHHSHSHHFLDDAAKVLGIKAEDLKQELKQGKSLSEIAAQKGIKEEELIQGLSKQISSRLSEGVKHGRLTEEKAAEIQSKVTEKLSKLVNRKWDAAKIEQSEIQSMLFEGVREQIKNTLKLEGQEFKTQMKAGKSLAQIAEEQNIEVSELITAIQKKVEQNLEQLVKDQKITPEKAEKIKEKLPEHIKEMVNRGTK